MPQLMKEERNKAEETNSSLLVCLVLVGSAQPPENWPRPLVSVVILLCCNSAVVRWREQFCWLTCFVCNFTGYFGFGIATCNFLIGDTRRRELSGDVTCLQRKNLVKQA